MPDPLHYAFRKQKAKARMRGISWKLEYWQWLMIWEDSGHLADRGVHKDQWVMARAGDQGAYEAGNVKIVRCQTNNSEAQLTKRRATARNCHISA